MPSVKPIRILDERLFGPIINNNLNCLKNGLKNMSLIKMGGRVIESTSLIIRACVPLATVGELCDITLANRDKTVKAMVVGFRENDVFLMPLGDTSGLSPNSHVIPSSQPFMIKVGYELLGRVLNGLGQPMDEGPPFIEMNSLMQWPLHREAPNPYHRKPVAEPLSLGVRVIDGLMTIGRGQRLGLFSGSGVGKSSLMGQMVRNTEAQIVVVCLVGERGREVMEFINDTLTKKGLKKSVVIVATSDAPSLVRYLSCYVATAIAEWFRDQGEDVLFLMDSATRFARAQREIGLALGEPPARQGYPPSVFAEIPRLMERTGANHLGTITSVYTVLVPGQDFDDPIADEVRGILDGHIQLNRNLAERGHWPAIDVLPSLSRVMNRIVDKEQQQAANKVRRLLAAYEKNRDLILLGAYKRGTDRDVDLAIEKLPKINSFLQQPSDESVDYKDAREQLINLV